MRRLPILPFLVAAWVACGAWPAWSGDPTAPYTADPLATQAAKNVLLYLQNVGRRANHRVVTGQHFGAAQCCSPAEYPAAGWAAQIEGLHTLTGKYPGIIGAGYVNYSNALPHDVVDYTTLNSYLEMGAAAGSIIQIHWHANNPFVNDYWGNTNCNGGTLGDLVNPNTTVKVFGTSTSVYTAWRAQLDVVAGGLSVLQAAGIPVIWRPIMEQNGSPWWFMACNANMSQFQALWRDMFTYLTTTKGLHNLLWTFASNGPLSNIRGCPGVQGESGLCLYPGTAYVDIVGLDDYHDATSPLPHNFADDWRAWASLGKPLAYAERGPHSSNDPNGVFASLIPNVVANGLSSVPAVAYFMSYANGGVGIVDSPGAVALMNDTNAANQTDVKRALDCMAAATTYSARVACVAL